MECIDQYNLGRPEKALSFAAPPVADAFIPISYLATVAEGFEEHYGKDGIEEFLLTTEFSDRKVFDDREKPVYRRTHASTRTYGAVISSLKHRAEVICPNHVSRGRVNGHAA